MELRQLEAFAAVMSTGSITAAGRLLGRSQPAITRMIQELEAEIGYALFARSGPRVTPTEQGFLLFEDVEHVLAGLQQIRARADEIARGQSRPLHVAATSALAAGLVPAALALPGLARDTVQIQMRSTSPEQVVHAVLTGAADVGVTSLPLEHRGIVVHWIGEAACVAAVRSDDPLASYDRLPLAACVGRRIITMQNPYRLRRRLDQAFAQAGVAPVGLIETNASINAMTAVRAGLGVAVLEPVTAYGLPLADVAVRPIDADIPFFFGVITRDAREPSPAALAFVSALADAARNLLPDFAQRAATEHAQVLQSLYGDLPAPKEALSS
ncbi:LysR family transcriptional regulator [Pandoraea apista]|uniref:LysR family transcriptional regulator n=1 Tax=Pandoraea apista TaxID=93218 RepID=A0A0B5F1S2_9BURK|nr:LysR family transcriptional regulator [Pandoraea apista]AJE97300.1 LysR family transcriptional regulator [Pandoraea apista]AKH71268.1 LysR family transcriptional regulator [Pandoraea apista]AKI63540.1 LysR family transcriptional regulator [Pandoraea apista]ALS67367.1 LysR family transcriptional regulator [Pandoraea apista]AVF41913.1 LysR family transcriptional regulator [Pandoraea apista]